MLTEHLRTLTSGSIESRLQPRKPAVYPANAIVYTQGEQQHKIFYLASGLVKLSFFDRHGREKVLGKVEPGEFFGGPGAFGSRPYGVTALVMRTSTVYTIPLADTRSWFRDQPELVMAIMKSMSETIFLMGRQLCSAVFQDARGCVASCILNALEHQTPMLRVARDTVAMTQQELAVNAGLSRVTVSKVLQGLRAERVVRLGKGQIEVTDLPALRENARI